MIQTLAQFTADTKAEFPDFGIRMKNTSTLMKVISVFLLIVTFGTQRVFMTNYITTIRHTVYVPNDWATWTDPSKVAILRHERVHMRQAKKYTFPLFMFIYLFFPLPFFLAWGRARLEMEAYTESMRAVVDINGPAILDDPKYKKSITDQFTTGMYGWMWPFSSVVSGWYDAAKKQIQAGLSNG